VKPDAVAAVARGAAGFLTTDVRKWLWPILLCLVGAVLGTLIWLASIYETSQVQDQVERNTAVAGLDIRQGLNRNVQSLQALQAGPMDESTWSFLAATLLYERRELLRVRWLDADFRLHAQALSPYEAVPGDPMAVPGRDLQIRLACSLAAQTGVATYSGSYFQTGTTGSGIGQELVDVCQAVRHGAQLAGFQVGTYSLKGPLAELVAKPVQRTHELSFTDADGARLAVLNAPLRRSSRAFSSMQVIDLPGTSLTLKLMFWHAAPGVFPNVLTALVTFMTIALVTVMILLAKDMRRRQRAEQEVADALAFRNAMESSLVTGLRARDLGGRISYVNPAFCEMVDFSAEELLGTSMPAPYWPPESIEQYLQRQALLHGADRLPPRTGYESVFMRRDGTRFPVLIFEAPLVDAVGKQTGWMSAVIDVSEQRRVEEMSRASLERLQASARLATVGEMASLISHEVNQPLAAIASYASGSLNLLAQEDGARTNASPATVLLRSAVQQIAAQAERAGKVITSVRDFVQRRHQAHEWVPPQQFQPAIEPLLSLQARKVGVSLVWQIEPGLPPVLCDRIMIEQVLLNLARNGIQSMEHSPRHDRRLVIRVARQSPAGAATAHGEGAPAVLRSAPAKAHGIGGGQSRAPSAPRANRLVFSVIDRGSGIPAELHDRLFTHFFSTKREGMGLGLSLCRTVVEQHGGELSFEPNGPCGTIFRFTLPLVPQAVPPAETPRDDATAPARAQPTESSSVP